MKVAYLDAEVLCVSKKLGFVFFHQLLDDELATQIVVVNFDFEARLALQQFV